MILPKTQQSGAAENTRSLSAEHAEKMIEEMPCPTEQKLALIDAVVKDARRKDT